MVVWICSVRYFLHQWDVMLESNLWVLGETENTGVTRDQIYRRCTYHIPRSKSKIHPVDTCTLLGNYRRVYTYRVPTTYVYSCNFLYLSSFLDLQLNHIHVARHAVLFPSTLSMHHPKTFVTKLVRATFNTQFCCQQGFAHGAITLQDRKRFKRMFKHCTIGTFHKRGVGVSSNVTIDALNGFAIHASSYRKINPARGAQQPMLGFLPRRIMGFDCLTVIRRARRISHQYPFWKMHFNWFQCQWFCPLCFTRFGIDVIRFTRRGVHFDGEHF